MSRLIVEASYIKDVVAEQKQLSVAHMKLNSEKGKEEMDIAIKKQMEQAQEQAKKM